MKQNIKEIKIGQGLGDLQFGMTRDDVKLMLGEPTEIDTNPFDEPVGEQTETWHYDELKLSLSFQEPQGWELDTISVTDAFYELEEEVLIGKSLEVVKAGLIKMDITDLELEDHSDEQILNHQLLSSDEAISNFWFDNGILSEIQWGPDDEF